MSVTTGVFEGGLRVRFLTNDPQFERISLVKEAALELCRLMPMRKSKTLSHFVSADTARIFMYFGYKFTSFFQ